MNGATQKHAEAHNIGMHAHTHGQCEYEHAFTPHICNHTLECPHTGALTHVDTHVCLCAFSPNQSHANMHVRRYAHTQTFAQVHTRTFVHKSTYVHKKYTRKRTRTRTRTRAHVHTSYTHTHTQTRARAQKHTQTQPQPVRDLCLRACQDHPSSEVVHPRAVDHDMT